MSNSYDGPPIVRQAKAGTPQCRLRLYSCNAIMNITALTIHPTKQSTRVSLHTGPRIHLYPIILPSPPPLSISSLTTYPSPSSQPSATYRGTPPCSGKTPSDYAQHQSEVLPRQQAHSQFPPPPIPPSFISPRAKLRPIPAVYTRTACALEVV